MSSKKVFFYGYASVFNVIDLNNDVILENSFKWNKNVSIPVFLEHNPRKKIGKILKISQNSKGLFVEGVLESKCYQGEIKLSVGYVLNDRYVRKNGVRFLSNLTLFEISIVKKPANINAIAICL